MNDYTKIALNDLTPEQLDGIKQDYLYNTKLTVGDMCSKWNITSYTYGRLAGKWKDYYDAGVERPCEHCGKPFITHKRINTICSDCTKLKQHMAKKDYYEGIHSKAYIAKRSVLITPVKVPPLELKRKYKFRDIDYDYRTKEDKVIKQGTLIQITDHFAVFDTGKYKAAVSKTDILSVV